MSFSDLGLSPKVLQAVESSGYREPTPIQAQAIPHVLARRDVLGIAQTGTGKTAAFTLPMLTLLETGRARARMPRTLILEPTRELAAQVEESFIKYGANHKLNVALLIGGVSFGDQDAKITRGVDVLIATPGRLLDHFERGKLLLTGIEILVIDEADRMLDMGFIPDIERICRLVPFTRQTLFFSATMPPEIQRLVDNFLHNPVQVEVARPATAAASIVQRLVASGGKPEEKRATLRRIIRDAKDIKNGIIFCNRKRDLAIVHRSLERHGFSIAALHGDMDQRSRMQALDRFRTNEVQLLIASDVAARGLDIPDVSHIFNFDVPHHPEDYIHRIGRTGRAGRAGTALMIVAPTDDRALAAIQKLTGLTIEWLGPSTANGAGDSPAEDSPRPRRRGRDRDRDRSTRGHGRQKGDRPHRGDAASRPQRHPDRTEARTREAERPAERLPDQPASGDGAPVGLGNHVPAFLLRPTRLPKAEPVEES
jgi:superfamily II DNA/RNA helicase